MTPEDLRQFASSNKDIIAENIAAEAEATKAKARSFLNKKFPKWEEQVKNAVLRNERVTYLYCYRSATADAAINAFQALGYHSRCIWEGPCSYTIKVDWDFTPSYVR